MTNEEAIKQIDSLIDNSKSFHEESSDIWEQDIEALNIAKQALEKQIPKKPILDTIFPSGVKWWRCPACRHNNIETNDRFCHDCGQALDWSDTK